MKTKRNATLSNAYLVPGVGDHGRLGHPGRAGRVDVNQLIPGWYITPDSAQILIALHAIQGLS